LLVSFWYPAGGTDAKPAGPYIPGPGQPLKARLLSTMLRVRVQSLGSAILRDPLSSDWLSAVKTHVVDNAEVSNAKASFPVLLFSPGFGASPTEYSALLEDIASHGYVVVAIHPTDFLPVTVFEDGRAAYAPLWSTALYDLQKDYPIWVQDMLFAVDQVFRADKDPQSPFFNRLDLTKVGAFGHSFGGAAAAGACHFDSRIRAGLNLDGAPQGNRSTWKFPQPFMLVQSDRRAYQGTEWESFFNGLSAGYRVVIKGSTHHAFTDEVILELPENQRKRRLVGTVPGPRMVSLTSALVCAFFDVYLQAGTVSLLQDVSSRFPEVEVQAAK
jgi:hypothetical protein